MHGSFSGWYFKCQSDTQTLAVIPAVHQVGRKRTCSIQLITDDGAWNVTFPGEEYVCVGRNISIGANQFGATGVHLMLQTSELTAQGRLDFGPMSLLKYDIMGPFAIVPFMECRHSVWSMRHAVNGTLHINGKEYSFRNACGYWEGDRGKSFPKEYAWTQCCFPGGSLMLSVADIPLAGIHFTGIISAVIWQSEEYRLATYLGARAAEVRNRTIRIVQGELELEARSLERTAHPLQAPEMGDMVRTIHESASCPAYYRLCKGNRTIFEFETDRASFEYEYPL